MSFHAEKRVLHDTGNQAGDPSYCTLSFLTRCPSVLSWSASSGISWKNCWAINWYFEWSSCLRWAVSRAALDCYFSFPQRNFVCLGPGFSIELDRVKNLPYCETETFEVRFDAQGASLSVGNKKVILPIKVRCITRPSWSSPASSSACWSPLWWSSYYFRAVILPPIPCYMVTTILCPL